MAIYHLSVKLITRGAGRSSTAAAAYRAADRIRDERTGLVFDYTRKRGVEHTEIVLPASLLTSATAEQIAWAHDRRQLWNTAEAAENRKDARVAREYEVALPHELNPEQRRELVRAFAREIADRHGSAVDIAVHRPHRDGDTRNHHAHILATTRAVTERGLGAKTDIELKDSDRARRGLCPGRLEVTAIRERWAALVNEYLAEQGQAARVDHRSLEAQGVKDRDPTYHKGPAVTALERRAESAVVVERMREDIGERLKVAVELGRLERESQEIARSIIDTSTELKAAIAARDQGRGPLHTEPASDRRPSMADIRHDSRTQWLALIAEQGRAERQSRERDVGSSLDLTGSVSAAIASRTGPGSTREEAQANWLQHREHQSTDQRDAAIGSAREGASAEDEHAL